jgi:hypothetical protein
MKNLYSDKQHSELKKYVNEYSKKWQMKFIVTKALISKLNFRISMNIC